MGLCGGGDGGAGALRAEQEQRERDIRQSQAAIDEAFAGFSPSFYRQRAGAYEDFAMPQLAEQYQREKGNLVFELARRGLLGSGAAGTLAGQLDLFKTRQQRTIADEGINQANQLRQQVENQRQSLYGLAQTGLEPSLAASNALRTASAFQAPSVFQPVGQLFNDFATLYLARQVGNAYDQAGRANQPALTFNTRNAASYYR